ncbi:PHA/PHB synthase family protein [Aestuariivirga sp. YIM B02566]|uniref:Class I poly(R)-hydroxyalkanoic acid synthase n=1 Tax=Taklimakanibacter albus TaxID=2800327 RepID=A0ACC5QXZ6_9HYPH|nr:class I poly(R)-hydroxyalkanoic acid synthase [Aestuariivirga sp. YIM B02566]MBK1865248.1 class I poly(R)-hydroxyalkanoic acid synthase [Aestuariivirga sp. YIM B02566]
MNDGKTTQTDFRLADPAQFARNMAKVFEQAAQIARNLAETPPNPQAAFESQVTPAEQVMKTLGAVAQSYASDPQKLMDAQMKLWASYGELWQSAWRKALGEEVGPVAAPERGDKRFTDKDWQQNTVFDFLKQFYLLSARWAGDLVKDADGIDDHTRHKARFYVDQITNAVSPSNFALTNPEVLRTTLARNGANLIEGLKNLEADLKAGRGRLRIKQTDLSAFELGKNVATTPGKVVFQNDTFQLIQYSPTTERVSEIPLLIVPPWINKYYILDLNPKKSFVRWATEQGLTVFVVSWVNPDEKHGHKTFADYMRDGFLTALDKTLEATAAPKANVIGYCVGGSLVAASLGYLAAKGDDRVNSVTFFTTQVDFEKAGDLKVFVDTEQIEWAEGRMKDKGYLAGRHVADAFNMLRSNDLIWSYVVNNYMLGKEPMPFDLLYWNSDSTRMPAGVHSQYLRECYLNNRLAHAQMTLDGVRIDLKKVKLPIYNLAAREDHIAPLASVFRLAENFGGETRMVVSGSGHIAGVVNPPEAQKYQYWTNEKGASTLEDWLKGATEHPGSWWPDWLAWITPRSGKKVKARVPGSGKLPALEDAPGSYVLVKAE